SVGTLSVVLTKEQVSIPGYYTMQLRATQGDLVRHTNLLERIYIPRSLSGDAHWPELPTAFSEMEARVKAEADRAQDAAGKAGRFYTPKVSQPDANTMQMGFTPSEPGMPSIPSYRIPLPVGPEGPEGMGVVKYSFDPEIWRWVMKYTDGHINTYPGFSPHDRDKFVVWRDTFKPGRENANYGVGSDVLYENAKMFYKINSDKHGGGTVYGVEQLEEGDYKAKLQAAGNVANWMVTKCHSWSAYTAELTFMIETPPAGASSAGLILNMFEGWTFPGGTILVYIDGDSRVRIVDNTSGGSGTHIMTDAAGMTFVPQCGVWYTAKMTCAEGMMSLSIRRVGESESDGGYVECYSSSITKAAIESEKALRIQTRQSKIAGLPNTVYVDNVLMWEDYAPTKSEKYVHVESITTTEAVNEIKRTLEPSGRPYNFKRVRLVIYCPVASTATGVSVRDEYGNRLCYAFAMSTSSGKHVHTVIDVSHGYVEAQKIEATTANTQTYWYSDMATFSLRDEPLTCIRVASNLASAPLPAGTQIDIYGVRA
ncbi:MAG: hypothetical protein IJP02_06385, partial [Oscillospiraceae bacterium]|nr:hypothetical protein [Oscillospiraceae bacterium]